MGNVSVGSGETRQNRARSIPSLFLILAVLSLSLFSVSVVVAAPPGQDPPDPMPQDIQTVIGGLAKSVGVGFVLSFLFKDPGWFQDLGSKAKWWIIFSLSLGLPIGAQLLIDFVPPDMWVRLNPYWTAISWGFIGWAGSQVAYTKFVKPAIESEKSRDGPA